MCIIIEQVKRHTDTMTTAKCILARRATVSHAHRRQTRVAQTNTRAQPQEAHRRASTRREDDAAKLTSGSTRHDKHTEPSTHAHAPARTHTVAAHYHFIAAGTRHWHWQVASTTHAHIVVPATTARTQVKSGSSLHTIFSLIAHCKWVQAIRCLAGSGNGLVGFGMLRPVVDTLWDRSRDDCESPCSVLFRRNDIFQRHVIILYKINAQTDIRLFAILVWY